MASFGDVYPDLDTLVYQALRADLPDEISLASELDVFSVDELPLVMFDTSGAGMSENQRGVWPFTLTIWSFSLDSMEAFATANTVYKVLRSWSQSVEVPGYGGLRYRQPLTLLAGTGGEEKAMIGKPIRQVTGSFELLALEPPFFE